MDQLTSTRGDVQIDFCTLGMFIIDEIHPSPSARDQTIRTDIIGGAGTYSAMGARLLSPGPQSSSVGWIVDAGADFPEPLQATLASWQTGVLLRTRAAGELTTRGWNGYGGDERRDFKYLTPKKRLTADDLTPALLAARSFHLICGPERCIEEVRRIRARRAATLGPGHPAPIFVWEPVPDLCVPEAHAEHAAALRDVDVVSPNHHELGALFGAAHGEAVERDVVERQAQELFDHGLVANENRAVIVRCGAVGCFVLSATAHCWLPAYHTDASKVKDPTGGGNGFLGGLCVGLVRNDFDVVEAARWGSVAASFCIEQVGMPQLCIDRGLEELWNGTSVEQRLVEFRHRYSAQRDSFP